MIKPVALIGIDGTLAISNAPEGNDWTENTEILSLAKPVLSIAALTFALHLDNWHLVGFTSRNQRWRKLTMEWLVKHEIPLDELLMRDDKDFGTAPDVKFDLALKYFRRLDEDVHLVIDDREDVLAPFHALGITTMLVNGVVK